MTGHTLPKTRPPMKDRRTTTALFRVLPAAVGLTPTVEAKVHTIDGLAKAVEAAAKG
jgi:hypothetical protein